MQAQPNAMRRKAGAGRPPPEFGQVTPSRALRAALAQAAQDVAGMVAVAGDVDELRNSLTRFGERVPAQALLALIEGPEGRFGLMVLDLQVVSALIEMQTTGRVVPRPGEPRVPTRTDAVLCADFVDRVLEVFEIRVADAGLAIAPSLTGYRYALPLAEPRAIEMTLDDLPYRLFTAALDLGDGAKSGVVQLLLPFDPPARRGPGGVAGAAFTEALRSRVLTAETVLSATLFRHEMTLAEISRLSVGALIPVPRDALAEVSVEALDGRVLARGRLGQAGGMRAVRLIEEAAPRSHKVAGSAGGSPASPAAGLAAEGHPRDTQKTASAAEPFSGAAALQPGGPGGDPAANLAATSPAALSGRAPEADQLANGGLAEPQESPQLEKRVAGGSR